MGRLHKRPRHVDDGTLESVEVKYEAGPSRYAVPQMNGNVCECNSKEDGWVCAPCKELQNTEANTSGAHLCFGKDCEAQLDEDKERRRICLWCDKPTVPGRSSMEMRARMDQRMPYIRGQIGAKYQSTPEEEMETRLKQQRMSRRDLRGDEAVLDDKRADVPQFVRHLDTVNYERFMCHDIAPSGMQIFESKRGRWTYGREFLLKFDTLCKTWPEPENVRVLTKVDGQVHCTTDRETCDPQVARPCGLSRDPDVPQGELHGHLEDSALARSGSFSARRRHSEDADSTSHTKRPRASDSRATGRIATEMPAGSPALILASDDLAVAQPPQGVEAKVMSEMSNAEAAAKSPGGKAGCPPVRFWDAGARTNPDLIMCTDERASPDLEVGGEPDASVLGKGEVVDEDAEIVVVGKLGPPGEATDGSEVEDDGWCVVDAKPTPSRILRSIPQILHRIQKSRSTTSMLGLA